MDNYISLYIHIPFCKSKCLYCDFTSFDNMNQKMRPYVLALCEEIKQYGEFLYDKKVDTVFIGGGTPTVLPLVLMEKILKTLQESFKFSSSLEFTIESNPGTLNKDMLHLLKENKINRLSIGLQATQNKLLKSIGRIHNLEDFDNNYHLARKIGFKNINVDLIFSLPKQTLKDWASSLEYLVKIEPEHISCYSLIIEEDTPFGKLKSEGRLSEASEDSDRDMYHYARNFLQENKYKHYEISNFSKASFESRHNLNCWEYKPYLAMGLGGHSFFNGERYHNCYDLEKYIDSKGKIEDIKEDIEKIPLAMQYSEYMFLGLRLIEGISIKEFESRFKISFDKLFGDKVKKLVEMQLLIKDGNNIRLSTKGLDLSNIVFAEFLL
ncbi:MAG TPA: radical SAM family heme chaperone HemW [Defluviitaleaceae bacterium]|nr:oxygen-independent coproporphyrinogen III oxidase [Candidatus Epulonipiscium sp.]HOA79995.1 radical SAM family heme chaperone HemW [Defluviitaleaceae bacterium]